MRSNPQGLSRRPKISSAAAPQGSTAVGTSRLEQNGSEAPGDPEDGPRAIATSPNSTSMLSDRLAALPTLSLGDLRLEWRRLFRADPPRLSRDMTMRAVAYRLQEIAHGGSSKATQRRLAALA